MCEEQWQGNQVWLWEQYLPEEKHEKAGVEGGWSLDYRERINPPLHDSWFPISPLGALVSPPRAGPHPAFLRVQWQTHCRGEKILAL